MRISVFGIHSGIAAVVCFFMVSGYAMTALIQVSFPKPGDALPFYIDRFLRLAPQYYFYLLVCAVWVLVVGIRFSPAQTGSPDVVNVAANLLVIPMDFYMFNKSIGGFLLNVPAWTLGLEACFYLLLPWLLMSRKGIWLAAAAGAITWTLAAFGVIDSDWYGYRLLPGTLVFFLVGVAVQRQDWWLFVVLVGFFCLSAASLALVGKVWSGFNAHLLVGAAVGCLMLPLLAQLRRSRWDDRLGSASYGTYLAQWVFVSGLQSHFGEPWAVGLAVVGCVASGALTYALIEAPTVTFRRSRRRRASAHPGVLPLPAAREA